MIFESQRANHPRSGKHRPILDGIHVQMLPVIGHLVPDPGKRRRDDVQHLDTAVHERHVIILDHPAVPMALVLVQLMEPCAWVGLVGGEEAGLAKLFF